MVNNNAAAAKVEIARRVANMVALGLDPIAALRTVCGAEVVDQMIEDVYNTLRATPAPTTPKATRVAFSGRNRRPFLVE
jgi:hypothetical protein